LWHRNEETAVADRFATERQFFRLSLLYLFGHFFAILVETLLHLFGVNSMDWLTYLPIF